MRSAGSPTARGPARPGRASGPRLVDDATAFLGISEAELTPSVRSALGELLGEVDSLRRELGQMRERIAQLERLADQDSLLPVANRRAFVRELTRMMAFADRYGSPGCLLFFDVDNLKRINDGHGHAAGDACLARIAELLVANVRGSDVVGRLGGDELGVIMALCDPDTARDKATALRALIESQPLQWQGLAIPMSVSVGVCAFSGKEQPAEMLAAADRAMYRQKGRAAADGGPA